MSTGPPPTIFSLKKSFLDSQIRLLSSDLSPPISWQSTIPTPPQGDIPQRAIDQAMTKVNLIARKHNRTVYSGMTVRRVAEQIESVYVGGGGGEEGEGWVGGGVLEGEEVLRRGVDLTNGDIISLLPEDYPLASNSHPHPHLYPAPAPAPAPADLHRYQTLRARLLHASTSLKTQRLRNEYYTQLHEKLRPFSHPQRDVQPNLVTRGGELDREMERMRGLAVRLSVQIERAGGLVGRGEGGGGEEDMRGSEDGGVSGGRTGERLLEVVEEMEERKVE